MQSTLNFDTSAAIQTLRTTLDPALSLNTAKFRPGNLTNEMFILGESIDSDTQSTRSHLSGCQNSWRCRKILNFEKTNPRDFQSIRARLKLFQGRAAKHVHQRSSVNEKVGWVGNRFSFRPKRFHSVRRTHVQM